MLFLFETGQLELELSVQTQLLNTRETDLLTAREEVIP